MNTLIAVTAVGVLALLAEIFRFRKALYPLSLVGILIALGLAVADWNTGIRYFNDMMYFDNFAVAFSGVLLLATFMWFLMSESLLRNNERITDYTALISFSLGGSIVMVSHSNLIMLFLGIEILSIAMYVLAASNKREARSNEAGFKYFMMGAFASGFLLMGIALVYGVTGTFGLKEIGAYVSANLNNLPAILYLGSTMLLTGFVFKVAAAPFHFWAPDVYEGSPTHFTAYMTTVVKTAAFAAFLRLFTTCFGGMVDWWGPVLAVFAAISMILGNVMAVYQSSFKRMMAYSSVAHAGYMLMVIVALNAYSSGALLIYTTSYAVASIGLFAVLSSMTAAGNEQVHALKGFSKTNQLPAFVLTVLLFSMAGIPPVAGFFAKYYVFTGALASGYLWLVMIAILSSLIGVYYYFRVIITMYQHADRESVQLSINPAQILVLGLALILTLVIGLVPAILTNIL
jgi:NADH-quinone oxidoreductase subunit N